MSEDVSYDAARRVRELKRVFGSIPWLKPVERKEYRVRVFKSGNSVAVRLPADLGLKPGTEMLLRADGDDLFSLEPAERVKRKFNVAKVCGSATGLKPIRDEDRVFEDRPLNWPERDPT